MSIGVRQLTVLREFKPFGLTAEEQDGQAAADVSEKFDYFLFGSEVTRERDDLLPIDSDFSSTGSPFDCGDQELFIRGNRIIWSKGFEVHKRYSSSNNIVTACWRRMDAFPDALLCVLEINNLSIYYVSGEVICIPLPYTITNIWPIPFGLLLQKSTYEHRSLKTSSSILYARDTTRASKDYRSRRYTANQHNYLDPIVKEDGATLSSHLILKHPMDELQDLVKILHPAQNRLPNSHSCLFCSLIFDVGDVHWSAAAHGTWRVQALWPHGRGAGRSSSGGRVREV